MQKLCTKVVNSVRNALLPLERIAAGKLYGDGKFLCTNLDLCFSLLSADADIEALRRNLWQISELTGISVDYLAELNGINPSEIIEGKVKLNCQE